MSYKFNPITGQLDLVSNSASSSNLQVTAVYFGDPNTNGTWRIIVSGSNLSFQRREAGIYNEKMAATP